MSYANLNTKESTVSRIFQKFNPLKAVKSKPPEPELSDDERGLLTILSWRRSYGSFGVDMLEEHIKSLCPTAEMDDHGNLWVVTDPESRILFTAHTDTVHGKGGVLKQEVTYDPFMKLAYKSDQDFKTGDCLGADDGAGVWLLLSMIDANVPGTYVFFTGEECGGIGSRAAASHDAEKFKRFDQAIAFDRKGTTSVITHQFSRCCSDEYAKALSAGLTDVMDGRYNMAPDDGGIFTDTANLTELIPECTNISVGYDFAHSPKETLDCEYLFALRDACLVLDWTALPIKRDPNEIDYGVYGFDYDRYGSKVTSPSTYYQSSWTGSTGFVEDFGDAVNVTADSIPDMTYSAMIRYVRKNPELAAELLQDMSDDRAAMTEEMNELYERLDQMEMQLYAAQLEDE